MATALAAYAPQSFLDFWLHITVASTKILGFLFGVPVTSLEEIMTVNGFRMRIITQCTALHYIIILSAAILLYTRHSIAYRAVGLAVSIFIVITANAFRLIVTGVVGSISRDAFVIVHDYLWVAAFSLLILGIWISWAEKKFVLTRESAIRCCVVLFACTLVYGALLLTMPFYGGLMAYISSMIFRALISNPHADITLSGAKMLYSHAGGTLSASFTTDLMVVALYVGLILSAGNYGNAPFKRYILGLIIIIAINAAAIAGGGALAVIYETDVAVVFLWTSHGIMLQLTLLWWILRGSPRLVTK